MPTTDMNIIFTALAVVVGVLFIKTLTTTSETFIPSPYPRVMLADGNCLGRHKSMADFVYTHYPYYQEHSYFKPLASANSYADNVSFDYVPKTNLYTVYN